MRAATLARRGQPKSARLRRLFRSPVNQVAYTRVTSAACRIAVGLGSGVYWQTDFHADVAGVPGGYTIPKQLNKSRCGYTMFTVDDTDATVKVAGTGWLTVAQANAYGGSYQRSLTTGDTITLTSKPSVTSVGLSYVAASGQGVATVSIDGSLTAATGLPTAADLVTAGRLPSTALVANGGTLAPTTRCLDTYSANTTYQNTVLLAAGLTAGVHTVQVKVTGYKNPSASAVSVAVGGFLYATATTAIDSTRVSQGYSYTDDTAGTATGAGWASQVPVPSSATYGGSYNRTTTAGDYITFTTPANTTRVGMEYLQTSNGGIFIAEINGDKTIANLLPMAQDYVNLGILASTALIANGGTLDPTWRVYDQYGAGSNHTAKVDIAEGLTAGTHTVKLTNTAYKNAASSGTRLYITALLTSTATSPSPTLIPVDLVAEQQILSARDSAWSAAINCTPPAATGSTGPTQTYVGQIHGYEKALTETVTMDGSPVTLTDGQTVTGTRLVITQTTELHHPDWQPRSGDPKIADVTYVQTVTRDGIETAVTITWAAAVTKNADYVGMFPLDSAFSVIGWDTRSDLTLTAHDGGWYGKADSTLMYARVPGSMYAALIWAPESDSFGGRTHVTPDRNFVEDGAPATGTSKMYLSRVSPERSAGQGKVVTVGEVEKRRVFRQVARFPQGAAAALA